jgi:glycosyltransferase involved in cell wall biosynthesis
VTDPRPLILGCIAGLGGSLTDLARHGQATRLLDYYLPAYLERFDRVRLFSWQDETLAAHTDDPQILGRVQIVAPARPLPRRIQAAALATGRSGALLRECDMVRVLQAPGAVVPMLAAARYVCTYGYSYPAFTNVPAAGPLTPALLRVKRGAMRAGLAALLRRAHATIVTSPAGEEEARDLGARRIWRIPNGVDLNIFYPRVAERRFDIVVVGRLEPQKDLPTLIAAAAQLDPHPRVALVGDGSLRADIARHAAEAGVPLELLGTMPNHAVAETLAESRCFVLPSLYEGHPKALLEAMATAVPCVGTDIPGIRELAAGGGVLLFPPGDAAALAGRLRQLLNDPVRARRVAQAARASVVARFDLRALLHEEAALLAQAARSS